MPLGSMIAAFKAACTKKYQQEFPESRLAKENLPLFEPGFNDKIAFRAGAKDAFYNYIADNPRRYLIKKLCPEYFFHKLMIEINGTLCGIYGNLFLLDNPIKSFVRISRIPERTPEFETRKKRMGRNNPLRGRIGLSIHKSGRERIQKCGHSKRQRNNPYRRLSFLR